MLARIQLLILLVSLAAGTALGAWLSYRFDWHWTSIVLFALAALPVSHAVALVLDFALTEMVDKDKTTEGNRSGASALVRAYLTEVWASSYAFGWLQPLFARRAYPQISSEQALASSTLARAVPVPVLLLHGYFCNRAMWRPLVRHLREDPIAGHRLIEGISMEPAFGSIDRYSEAIHQAVTQLQEKTGRKPVLIGHSMGGLAARAYLRSYGESLVGGVITLGTPHQGTFLAEFGHGVNVKQMRLNSVWLGDLATHERQRQLPPFEVILSLHDNIVSPRAQQTIPQANTQMVEGIGHMGLAINHDIWRLIDRILARWDKTD